ncbi:MAG: hypothetical protein OEU26_15900, partial [Candidatus Tectomicrobia bacterium]|nr:hypothetical protein [Candidatus Tectomicrobia bacterium]
MMNEPMLESMESSDEANEPAAAGCPMQTIHASRPGLEPDDELVLPQHKRMITQYSTDASGVTELYLYYDEKEITFDEPELFAFGEGLGKQARFVAKTATTWGEGYDWPQVRELLEQLLAEGILRYADANEPEPVSTQSGARPSPLPAAQSTVPHTWFECEAITRELTGHTLELGYLELVVPIFRVAHMAMDAEGRQVGEANVFPKPLRLDVPTEWRTCPYAGSRFQNDRPINTTALKSMGKHWKQMMIALSRIREAYLHRFPTARDGWTVGDLERLSTLVLTVPAYLLMGAQQRVENGHLHPVLSSMFRVTDGVRITMHQMLFLPLAEPTLPPDATITSAEIYAYAERNYGFHSSHGVCAAPKVMIEEFLNVLVDGWRVESGESVALDTSVQAALDDLNSAFDYALYGLQAYAVVFSLWPAMSRAYEQLLAIVEAWSGDHSETLLKFRQRLRSHVQYLQTSTLLRTEEWRVSRDQVYADMYAQCASGLGSAPSGATLAGRLAPVREVHHANAADQLRTVLQRRLCRAASSNIPELESLVTGLMDYL